MLDCELGHLPDRVACMGDLVAIAPGRELQQCSVFESWSQEPGDSTHLSHGGFELGVGNQGIRELAADAVLAVASKTPVRGLARPSAAEAVDLGDGREFREQRGLNRLEGLPNPGLGRERGGREPRTGSGSRLR